METLITPEGLARLTDELSQLTTIGRREAAERIQWAASSEANASENADYHDARDAHALLERRIAVLERRIAHARVVEPDLGNGRVDVGERVRLRDVITGDEVAYELVGPFEAEAGEGRVSIISPLGRALVGRQNGDVVVVDAPIGELRFEIVAVETPALEPARCAA